MVDMKFVEGLGGDSAPVLALYKDIVDKGVPVECYPGEVSPHTRNGNDFATADWHLNERTWKIYFPADAHSHQVYHELLHVHFRSVQGAPMMSARLYDATLCRNVEELNNDFDHAYVVPMEIMKYPEATKYWEADFNRMFSHIPPSSVDQLGMAQRKLTLLRGWLILPVALPSAEITEKFRSELTKDDWLEAANAMTTRVKNAAVDKAQAVQAFRDALGIDFPRKVDVGFSQ